MQPGKLKFIPQKYDELIKLANHISKFKTEEMEIIFAKLIARDLNPIMKMSVEND